jgi:hypothetical protein
MVCVTKLLCLYDKTDWRLKSQHLDGDERAKLDILAAVKRIQMDYAY